MRSSAAAMAAGSRGSIEEGDTPSRSRTSPMSTLTIARQQRSTTVGEPSSRWLRAIGPVSDPALHELGRLLARNQRLRRLANGGAGSACLLLADRERGRGRCSRTHRRSIPFLDRASGACSHRCRAASHCRNSSAKQRQRKDCRDFTYLSRTEAAAHLRNVKNGNAENDLRTTWNISHYSLPQPSSSPF